MHFQQLESTFFVVIINKQVDKNSFTFNLNVEFREKMKYNRKNPLTKKKIECIIKSARKQLQTTTQSCIKMRGAVTTENRRVVYVC